MQVHAEIVEHLLFEDEDVSIDFKADAYPFKRASDDQKSELLKDILAFANAFRRTDAYILTGVEHVKGGRNKVTGIAPDVDDAAVQQFVNSKTNVSVEFSLKYLALGQKIIGLIHIPLQKRPIYLKKDYGKLKAKAVYLRRGSSTGIATIEEIAAMGDPPPSSLSYPAPEVFLADPKSRKRLLSAQSVQTTIIETPPKEQIPAFHTKVGASFFPDMMLRDNERYFEQFGNFLALSSAVKPFYVGMHNGGDAAARDLRLEIRVEKYDDEVLVMDCRQFPERPSPTYHLYESVGVTAKILQNRSSLVVGDLDDEFVIEAEIPLLRAKDSYWFEDPIYIGRAATGGVRLAARVFCFELGAPVEHELGLSFQVDRQKLTIAEIFSSAQADLRDSGDYKLAQEVAKFI